MSKKKSTLILVLLFLLPFNLLALEGNQRINSFSKAKKILPRIYKGHEYTIYCNCNYKKKKVNHASCGYSSPKGRKRSKRIEWEHIVPAHAMGHSFTAWRSGNSKCISRKGKSYKGRKCARKVNKIFRRMEADLYNLFPAVGEINGLRSNYSFANIPGEKRKFGKCDFEVEKRKAEPRTEIRGIIARTYLYMDQSYPGHGIISRKNSKLFAAWDKQWPVTQWECQRAKRIEKVQKNINYILNERCKRLKTN